MAVAALEAAYAAGLIDGEGTITIRMRRGGRGHRSGPYHHLVVSISNTDPKMVKWLADRWPGHLGVHRYSQARYRTLYRWVLEGAAAERFVTVVAPFLVTKREHAEIALALRKTKLPRGQKLTSALRSQREQLRSRIAVLNTRGSRAA